MVTWQEGNNRTSEQAAAASKALLVQRLGQQAEVPLPAPSTPNFLISFMGGTLQAVRIKSCVGCGYTQVE